MSLKNKFAAQNSISVDIRCFLEFFHKSTADPSASSVRLLKLFPNDPTWDLNSIAAINLLVGDTIKKSQSFVGRK